MARRRRMTPELSATAETPEEDLNRRFSDLLRETATQLMHRRDSNVLTDADFRAAWRHLPAESIQSPWKRIMTESVVLVAGAGLSYGVMLAQAPEDRIAGPVVIVMAMIAAIVAWCWKYAPR